MAHVVLMAIVATLGTWFVTAAGAATVIFFRTPDQKALDPMLGFAAGVMVAASFWSLLQPAAEQAERMNGAPPSLVVTGGFLSGALFLWLTDQAARLARGRASGARREDGASRALLLVLSITLHNIPEGLAVGVAFGALQGGEPSMESLMGAVSIAVGIGLQNFPEGAAVSLPLRREGYSAKRSFLIGQASGLAEPAAGIVGALLVAYVRAVLPYALSFAAGAMILVAVHDLIPECQKGREARPYAATMGVMLGFAAMTLLDVMLG